MRGRQNEMEAMLIVDVLTDVKFVLLHEGKNDDGIRGFFMEVWELFIKVSVCGCSARGEAVADEGQTQLNPFYSAQGVIRSGVFDGRVRASAKKHL